MLLWTSGFGLLVHVAHHGPRPEAIAFVVSQAICFLALCFEAGYHEAGRARPKFAVLLRIAAVMAISVHAIIAVGPALLPQPAP